MKSVISTQGAPAAIGPYSQAICCTPAQLVFTAGQIPLDPAGTLVEGGIEAQTRQVLANLKAVLEAAGSSLDQVLKVTIFLKDMNDFPEVNRVYGESFPVAPPARSTVEVSRLPRDVRVEIEAIACVPASGSDRA